MLKPFQIRNLQEGESEASQPVNSGLGAGVVQISAPEYDAAISEVPEATLTYLDDDDGETITVGSSFELSDRLEERVPRTFGRCSRRVLPSLPLVALNRLSSPPSSPSAPPMHVFDINRSGAALDVWKGFEQRTRSTANQVRATELFPTTYEQNSLMSNFKPHSRPAQTSGLGVQVDHSDDQSRQKELQNERDRWLWACNPPQIPPKIMTSEAHKSLPASTLSFQKLCENMQAIRERDASKQTRLTVEGQRQAKEAGARFIHGKKPRSFEEVFKPAEAPQHAHENRWASYKDHLNPEKEAPMTEASPRADLVQHSQNANISLLEAFEKEMARRLEPRPQQETTIAPGPSRLPTAQRLRPAVSLHHVPEPLPVGAPAPAPANSHNLSTPGDMMVQTIQALVTGVSQLGSELKSNFPEIERTLAQAHQNLPEAVEETMRSALRGFGQHAQTLAATMQEASDTSRAAAHRTREADLTIVDNVFEGLKGLVGEIGNVGKTLFSAFDAELTTNDVAREEQPLATISESSVVGCQLSPIHVVAEVPTESRSVESPQSRLNFFAALPKSENTDVSSKCVPGCLLRQGSHPKCIVKDPKAVATQISFPQLRFVPRSGQERSRSPPSLRGIKPYASHEKALRDPRALMSELHLRAVPTNPNAASSSRVEVEFAKPTPQSQANEHEQSACSSKPLGEVPSSKPAKASVPASSNRASVAFTDQVDETARSEKAREPRRIKSLGTVANEPFSTHANQWNRPLGIRHDSNEAREKLEKAYASTAILDQEDSDPDFSARYPSLLSSGSVRRANTIGAPTDSSTSVSRSINPESEIARYPTMQQFEQGRHHPDPLPPTNVATTNADSQRSTSNPHTLPGAWPTFMEDLPQESSGEFFKRMTGLDAPNTNKPDLHRSNTAADPAARLPGPWDPLADLATATQHLRDEHLRRSHTERGPHRHARRPYSERFSGTGRMPWESFITPPRMPGAFPVHDVLQTREPEAPYPTLRRMARRYPHLQQRPSLTPLNIPAPTLRHSASMRNPVQAPMGPPQHQPTQPKTKIETCVSHLRNLGYAAQVRGGMERLKIYAEATGGDLGDSIEMIEEERKAYEGSSFS